MNNDDYKIQKNNRTLPHEKTLMHPSWANFHQTIVLLELMLLQSLVLRGQNSLLCDVSGLSPEARILFSSFCYFAQPEQLLHNSSCFLQHEEPELPIQPKEIIKKKWIAILKIILQYQSKILNNDTTTSTEQVHTSAWATASGFIQRLQKLPSSSALPKLATWTLT